MKFCRSALYQGTMAVAVVTALAACSPSVADTALPPSIPEVLTARAKPAEGIYELRLPARTQAGESARIHPRATGFVSEWRADIGDAVRAGDLLAVISAPEVDQAVLEAQAMLAKAKADQELARVNYERARVLVDSGVVSEEMYSDRKANHEVAVAARGAAQARLASALERQDFQSVRTPFTGVVVARNVERGDRVVGDAASAQPMFEINALDPLRVVVNVPQNVAMQIERGMEGTVSFPELPGEVFKAQVVRSARAISREAGMMRTELRLPNPDNRIPAGMVGTVDLRLSRPSPLILVPVSAVVQYAGGARVATLKNSVIEYRDVSLGRNLGNDVEVLAGISAHETVVLSPNALLMSGTKVKARAMAPGGK